MRSVPTPCSIGRYTLTSIRLALSSIATTPWRADLDAIPFLEIDLFRAAYIDPAEATVFHLPPEVVDSLRTVTAACHTVGAVDATLRQHGGMDGLGELHLADDSIAALPLTFASRIRTQAESVQNHWVLQSFALAITRLPHGESDGTYSLL
jgi:hypothetical protein